MTLAPAVLALVVGLVVLVRAADLFVVAAEGLAVRLRWSPTVIGAVVVGFGTSLPELTTSALAAAAGELDLALGNAAGSNVANLLLVLGLAALVRPVVAPPRAQGRDTASAIAAGLLLVAVSVDGRLGWVEGAVLLVGLGLAVAWQVRAGVGERLVVPATLASGGRAALARRLGLGLVGVVAGAQALVWGASTIATELGVPRIVVGSVLVAIGTSLPELATAIASARRGQTELLLGNLLGSNAFNALGVVGTAALVGSATGTPLGLDRAGFGVVVAAAIVTLVVGGAVWWTGRLRRVAAAALVGLYLASIPWLVAVS